MSVHMSMHTLACHVCIHAQMNPCSISESCAIPTGILAVLNTSSTRVHTCVRTCPDHACSSKGATNLSKLNPSLELAEGSGTVGNSEAEVVDNDSCTDSEATVAYNEASTKA